MTFWHEICHTDKCDTFHTGSKIIWLLILGHIRWKGAGYSNDEDKRGGRKGQQFKQNYNLIERWFHGELFDSYYLLLALLSSQYIFHIFMTSDLGVDLEVKGHLGSES